MNAIIKNNILDIHNVCRKYKVKNLYIFGSVCSEKFNDKSDIDFLISFKDIPIEEYSDNYFALHELLQNLFSRQIDLGGGIKITYKFLTLILFRNSYLILLLVPIYRDSIPPP